MSPFRCRFPKAEVSVIPSQGETDDNSTSTLSLLLELHHTPADRTHEHPHSSIMIRTSCAWVRSAGTRRITNASDPPQHRLSALGKASRFEFAPTKSPKLTRRWNASSPPPIAQKAPESSKTIPGPSWLWLEPIYEPFRAYGRIQQRRPYMTQFVSSLVIYFVGDVVAQSIGPAAAVEEEGKVKEEEQEEKGWVQEWSAGRDWARTGRALLIGGLAAVPGYKWFLWLSNSFNYSSKVLSLTTKVRSSPLANGRKADMNVRHRLP